MSEACAAGSFAPRVSSGSQGGRSLAAGAFASPPRGSRFGVGSMSVRASSGPLACVQVRQPSTAVADWTEVVQLYALVDRVRSVLDALLSVLVGTARPFAPPS